MQLNIARDGSSRGSERGTISWLMVLEILKKIQESIVALGEKLKHPLPPLTENLRGKTRCWPRT
jgi:hypothetical protein